MPIISTSKWAALRDPVNYLTPVGTFATSPSASGTVDQNGDVGQWTETAYFGTGRGVYGGEYASGAGVMASESGGELYPLAEGTADGFRVAYVPEPSTAALLLAGR